MKKIEKIVIVLIFITLTTIVCTFHEPWADEAQAWLIARCSNILELLQLSKYEGTIPLWHLIIKFFILIGLDYNHFYVIPIIFSTLGLIVFLNNENIPKSIRIIVPFTYYIFYQFTIVARSYCLFFLAFSIFLYTYNLRKEKKIFYFLTLVFFSLISTHGMLICLILGISWLIELLKEKEYKKFTLYFILLAIIGICELIIIFPSPDVYIYINLGDGNLWGKLYGFFYLILCGASHNFFRILPNAVSLALLLFFMIYHTIKSKNKVFIISIISMFIYLILIRAAIQHIGILFELILFSMLINFNEVFTSKKLKVLFITMLSIYSLFTVYTSYNDITENYTGAKDVAQFIKDNIDLNQYKIKSIDFYSTALQPYFDKNILENRDTTYFVWTSNDKDYYNITNLPENATKEDIIKILPKHEKYLVIDDQSLPKYYLKTYLDNSNDYKLIYKSNGVTYYKTYFSLYQDYFLYEKIN